MDSLNTRILNNKYAPGIATYGINGKDGSQGDQGTSIYFTSYNIENTNDRIKALSKVTQNKIISDYIDEDNQRPYIIGDLIMDSTGSIYRLIWKDGVWDFDEKVTTLQNMSDADYFYHVGNHIAMYNVDSSLGTEIKGLDIFGNNPGQSSLSEQVSTNINNDYTGLLRIINGSATGNNSVEGNLGLVTYQTVSGNNETKYLNIYYNNNDDAFYFDSNANLLFDASTIAVNSNNNTVENTDYYKIDPYSDPIGLLHKVYSQSYYMMNINDQSDLYLYIKIPKEKNISGKIGLSILPDFFKIQTYSINRQLTNEYVYFNTMTNMSDCQLYSDDPDYYYFRILLPNSTIKTMISSNSAALTIVKGIGVMIKSMDFDSAINDLNW